MKKKKNEVGGRQTKTEPPDLLPRAEGPASTRGWGRGQERLAGPALHLALGAVLVVGGPRAPAAQARDPVAHVEQHHLQWVCVHAPLVGLRRALHVFHDSAREVFALWGEGHVCRGHARTDPHTWRGLCTQNGWGSVPVRPGVYVGGGNTYWGMCGARARDT